MFPVGPLVKPEKTKFGKKAHNFHECIECGHVFSVLDSVPFIRGAQIPLSLVGLC